MGWNPLSRERVHDSMQEVSDCLEEVIRRELSTVETIAATSDLWSDINGQQWATISVHWIDQTFNLRVRNIGVIRVKEKSGVSISELIQAHVNKFIDPTKTRLVCIVTDQGGEMLVATSLLPATLNSKQLISCIGHIFHNSVTDALEDDERVALIRKICVHFRNNERTFVKKMCEYQLLKDQDTRWSSIYFMIVRFCKVAAKLEESFSQQLITHFFPKEQYPNFTVAWSKLVQDAQTIQSILEPFYKYSTKVQGNFITLSSIPSMVNKLLNNLLVDRQRDSHVQVEVKSKLYVALSKRTEHIFKRDSIYLCAAFLDARFNLLEFLIPDPPADAPVDWAPPISPIGITTKRSEVKTSLHELYRRIFAAQAQPRPRPTAEEVSRMTAEEQKQVMDSIAEDELSLDPIEVNRFEISMVNLRSVKLVPDFPTLWNGKIGSANPVLRKLATAILAIPGSSAESERAFSIMGRIISKYRTRALDETSQVRFMIASNIPKKPQQKNDCKNFFRVTMQEITAAKLRLEREGRPQAAASQGGPTRDAILIE